jgi:hypothetical protein
MQSAPAADATAERLHGLLWHMIIICKNMHLRIKEEQALAAPFEGRISFEVDSNGIRVSICTMNEPHSSQTAPPFAPASQLAQQPPAINFTEEWLDEHGRVCPKNVDYMTQCPKGHALAPVDCSGLSEAGEVDIMCRVCHTSAPVERACDWLACSIARCCSGYAVCAACLSALGGADTSAVKGEDFPLEVRALRAVPRLLLRLRFCRCRV